MSLPQPHPLAPPLADELPHAPQQREEWFRAVFEGSAMGIAVVDRDGRILEANMAFQRIVGRSADALRNVPFGALDHPDDHAHASLLFHRLVTGRIPSYQVEVRWLCGDGGECPVRLTSSVVRDGDGQPRFCVAMVDDLTHRARAEAQREVLEERLRHLALHDPLTGLPNRVLLGERMRAALEAAGAGDDPCAVLFLDLDRFKNVNDSLGHGVGDELLRQVAARFAACARPGDTVARFGGDEFVFFIPHAGGREGALAMAARVRDALAAAPLELGNYRAYTTATIGIALADVAGDTPEELLRNADMAMYHAKAGGGRRTAVYDGSMHRAVVERLRLETDLRAALARTELRLFFQPIISLVTGQMVGAEALSRWDHPVHGWVPPDRFITLAEDTGLIGSLGAWVLAEAARQVAEWRATLPAAAGLEVSVNVSPWQLREELVETVAAALGEYGLPPAALKLELTESSLVEDPATAAGVLRALKRREVQVYLDDFGTGYSSLSSLHRLPLDALKIDRSFVGGMDGGTTGAHKGAEIVRTIVALARSLGVRVVAEGVETHEQLAALRALGCDFAQGYLISPPLPAEEFAAAFLPGDPPFGWHAGHRFG